MNVSPASPLQEHAQLQQWTLRAAYTKVDWFARLIDAEFRPADEQRQRQERALAQMLRFAAGATRHYRDSFAAVGFDAERHAALDTLARLPIVQKPDVLADADGFRATALPAGEELAGATRSSGTTGRPVTVWHTRNALRLNNILGHRHLRWYRYDPRGVFASIRQAGDLPRTADGAMLREGDSARQPYWPQIGQYFHTGVHVAFGITNPIDAQLEWLLRERPDYLMSYSESLEHLALAAGSATAVTLRGATAISEQLTADMQTRIERTFSTTVNQGYGLNEAGLVAVKCREGDRYHVHSEHCLVEIVDAQGRPCEHGARGRIVITVLSNPATPLIRYDTDDFAVCCLDPCPCGRALPAFGSIIGRYSRIACLPDGTLTLVGALREALQRMPDALLTNLRRFQVHQLAAAEFEIRVQAVAPLPDAVHAAMRDAWVGAGGDPLALSFRAVEEIPRLPNGKFQDFTSVFFPRPDVSDAPNGSIDV